MGKGGGWTPQARLGHACDSVSCDKEASVTALIGSDLPCSRPFLEVLLLGLRLKSLLAEQLLVRLIDEPHVLPVREPVREIVRVASAV